MRLCVCVCVRVCVCVCVCGVVFVVATKTNAVVLVTSSKPSSMSHVPRRCQHFIVAHNQSTHCSPGNYIHYTPSTLCLKKVPTFKLSVTLSNLNRFSKFLHCWKAYEICYKTLRHYLPHLRHVVTLPWEIKIQIFCRYSADIEENVSGLRSGFISVH